MKRTIEMAICYTDGTWRAEFFVEVDDIPPDPGCCGPNDFERLESLGQAQLDAGFAISPRPKEAPEIAKIWLYNSMEDEGSTPPRSMVLVKLHFDMNQITVGSVEEQRDAAIKQVNLSLQRQPYGLGANIEKYS